MTRQQTEYSNVILTIPLRSYKERYSTGKENINREEEDKNERTLGRTEKRR